MEQRPSIDRRRHVRYPLATTIQFLHGPSRREFPARSVDISQGGMLMFVPVATPVSPGQSVQVTIGSEPRPELHGLSRRPVDGTIVRVDRHRLLNIGHLPVAVRFNG